MTEKLINEAKELKKTDEAVKKELDEAETQRNEAKREKEEAEKKLEEVKAQQEELRSEQIRMEDETERARAKVGELEQIQGLLKEFNQAQRAAEEAKRSEQEQNQQLREELKQAKEETEQVKRAAKLQTEVETIAGEIKETENKIRAHKRALERSPNAQGTTTKKPGQRGFRWGAAARKITIGNLTREMKDQKSNLKKAKEKQKIAVSPILNKMSREIKKHLKTIDDLHAQLSGEVKPKPKEATASGEGGADDQKAAEEMTLEQCQQEIAEQQRTQDLWADRTADVIAEMRTYHKTISWVGGKDFIKLIDALENPGEFVEGIPDIPRVEDLRKELEECTKELEHDKKMDDEHDKKMDDELPDQDW